MSYSSYMSYRFSNFVIDGMTNEETINYILNVINECVTGSYDYKAYRCNFASNVTAYTPINPECLIDEVTIEDGHHGRASVEISIQNIVISGTCEHLHTDAEPYSFLYIDEVKIYL